MKIALLSESKTPINILPKLKENLQKQIIDAEVDISFVPSIEDLPFKAKKLAFSHKVVFVFSLYEDEEKQKAKMVLEKLVDVEVETGKKIFKVVEESETETFITEQHLEAEREELAKKWADVIVKVLFKPHELAPDEKVLGNQLPL